MDVLSANKKPKKKKRRAFNPFLLSLLIGGILLTILAPFLFTIKARYDWMRFDATTAEIGDTIGGITSPIVSLIAAILVYYSFQQQLEANEIQKKAMKKQNKENREREDYNNIEMLIKELKEDFDRLEFGDQRREKGIYALRLFIQTIRHSPAEVKNDAYEKYATSLHWTLIQIVILLNRLKMASLSSASKELLFSRFHYYYIRFIEPDVQDLMRLKRSEKYISSINSTVNTINSICNEYLIAEKGN